GLELSDAEREQLEATVFGRISMAADERDKLLRRMKSDRELLNLKAEEKRELEMLAKLESWEAHDDKPPYELFYFNALEHQHREGFLHLKLEEPRSYDYKRDRAWDDRLRMPQFKFARRKIHVPVDPANFGVLKPLVAEAIEDFKHRLADR